MKCLAKAKNYEAEAYITTYNKEICFIQLLLTLQCIAMTFNK